MNLEPWTFRQNQLSRHDWLPQLYTQHNKLKAWKKSGLKGIWTRDLCDSSHLGAGRFVQSGRLPGGLIAQLVEHCTGIATGSPSSLYEPHKEHNMASNYKGLYGIFYKISMKVIKSENVQ